MDSLLAPLSTVDPVIYDIIEKEKARQVRSLEMIASENFTSRAVMECQGSALTNKYAEGYVGARYYGGTEFVDQIETLAIKRTLDAFHLNPVEWGVNVQCYSGSPANFAVYTGLLKPHDRMMGLDLPCGGHLTHGFATAKKKMSASSIYFESMPYHTTSEGLIDYEELDRNAEIFRPAIIILGASAYPREYDYEAVRRTCDKVGCVMMVDMAHTAGLIAGGVLKSPFEYADVVTTTTHKSLRGPRSGMILFRKMNRDGTPTDFEARVNGGVFPGTQGGPHLQAVAGIATQMQQVQLDTWKDYVVQVQKNARALAAALMEKGELLVTNGTDNHLLMWNLRPHDITGSKAEKIFDAISISTNKNTIVGDKNAANPSGIRLGVCALTTREFKEKDMLVIANFVTRAIEIGVKIQETSGKKLVDFLQAVAVSDEIKALKQEVEAFAVQFPMSGFDKSSCKYL